MSGDSRVRGVDRDRGRLQRETDRDIETDRQTDLVVFTLTKMRLGLGFLTSSIQSSSN